MPVTGARVRMEASRSSIARARRLSNPGGISLLDRWRAVVLPAVVSTALVVLGVVAAPVPAGAQSARPSPVDAALGELSPPVEIAGLDAKPLVPLEFSRAWLAKAEQVRRRREELHAAGRLDGMSPAELAAEGAALTGTLRVPVIPVYYSDVEPPFSTEVLADRLFGPVRGDTMSYAAYWGEASGGLLKVEGEVLPWVKLSRPASHYLPRDRYGWASFGRIKELREEAIRAAAARTDFGLFDNDGPDGVPNSGDDDGFVDFVAIVYATDCKGDWRTGAIWPHRGAMPPIETRSPAAGGGRIKIADYVVLPVVDPGTCDPLHIGVLAHETGHALGLPDLYDYDGTSSGIGAWGLMGFGSNSAPHSPAHPGAWEKEQLGWVRVEWLKSSRDGLRIPPVLEDRTVYRYDLDDGTGRYLLFENRQRIGSDSHLPGSGLLVWRIDPDRGELGSWNMDERYPAVSVIEADGRGDLADGRPADEGDPFPGRLNRDIFEVHSPRPLRLSGIEERSGSIVADLAIGYTGPTLVGTPQELRLTAVAGAPASSTVVPIRREGGAAGSWEASTVEPWLRAARRGESLVVQADPTGLEPGTYRDTVHLSLRGEESPAGRIPVELRVTRHGEPEVIAAGLPWGWGLATRAGQLFQASYGWDPLGLRPRPRLLHLPGPGRRTKTAVRLPAEALYSPVPSPDGGVYILARAREENYLYSVLPDGRAELIAGGFGPAPAYGAATLRDGSVLVADWSGRIQRVDRNGEIEPWTELGTGIYQIAVDSAATLYAAAHAGHVLRVGPDGTVTVLPTGFGRGRLVAITASPAGDVFAAERGGKGRVLRIAPDGTTEVIATVEGAEFYGLAVEDEFLYALDLAHRQLLRFPLASAAGVTAAAPSAQDDSE